ncbi:cell adhesion molecule 4-like isoform X4 [Myxocyprinus asiaticus]|uniref:cell adhesion molecule 4-like isoform X4 n=1 Tax=Myxocyprinus asiaticus TaxID=70543 RepID=UPI002222B51B|nr:cell adhesion molecule 4-like isoform X4 [Myxocyprinus asiaticus]
MGPDQRSLLLSSTHSLLLHSLILLSLCPRGQAVQAENVTVLEGGTAQISCRLQNYDGSIVVIQNPRRQTLFFNGTRGVISQQENGKTVSVSNTIRIPVERKDNGAAMSCEASHPALVGQKRVRHYSLDVHFAPTVKIIPPQGILREGDSLNLICSVTGNPLPRDIQWSRVNDTLPERAEKTANILHMSRLSQSHNGTYLCQAHNNYGRAADHYTLLVYVSLPSTSHPAIAYPILPSTSNAEEYKDPGAVVETHSAVPYAVIGGILALLVFTVICVLIITIWCSVRQKGSYLTHEASGLDEHGEVQEAFLNGNDASQGKKEYLL